MLEEFKNLVEFAEGIGTVKSAALHEADSVYGECVEISGDYGKSAKFRLSLTIEKVASDADR